MGCNLGDPNTKYMEKLAADTKDIHISLLFNNAGYILPGFFADTTLAAQLSNFECNAGAAVRITHHFLNKMLDSGKKGFIGFTSSPGSMYPGSCFSLYGSTKAFVTAFGTSLAPELKSLGVDVLVVQPSPVLSNFYKDTSAFAALNFFKSTATTPARLANCFFRGAGRVAQFDQGYFAMSTRLLFKVRTFPARVRRAPYLPQCCVDSARRAAIVCFALFRLPSQHFVLGDPLPADYRPQLPGGDYGADGPQLGRL